MWHFAAPRLALPHSLLRHNSVAQLRKLPKWNSICPGKPNGNGSELAVTPYPSYSTAPPRSRLPHHHDAFQLGAVHYLCSLLGALLAWLSDNCPCFTWLSNIMANYLPSRPLSSLHSSATYHSFLTQPLCLPPTRLSTGWWFIWLRRLLLATWWVDATETNSPHAFPPFVAPAEFIIVPFVLSAHLF